MKAHARISRGFTLVEVMMALSILAIGLIGLIGRTAAHARATQEVAMRSVAVDLARGRMYDLEAELTKDGFQELDQSSEGDFSDEGWPKYTWEASVEKVELPNLTALDEAQGGEAETEDSAAGAGAFLGGMDSIATFYEPLTQILEVAIRKVTLTVHWTTGAEEQDLVVVCYFTDQVAMLAKMREMGIAR
jgi:prepilin-type N-terminal cleavage/methylation domain-containing protein